MLKIATHDSASGEKPKNLLSWLVIPFARTQSKTIKEQFFNGCRSFDIRVKDIKDKWFCAHGVFITKRTADNILDEINYLSLINNCCSQICITYEGYGKNNQKFLEKFHEWQSLYKNIIFGRPSIKYGDGSNLTKVKYGYFDDEFGDSRYEGGIQGFLPLDGRSWHIYLPIPWLWKKVYHNKHVFNEKIFTYVDFL